jgi:protein O-GlcNAc transferase
MSDNQAAETIRRDGIDVLVDLSGHLGDNRLLIFARKPAPVQASYLGDLGTTGLPTIDYYLTDAHADPPGWTEEHYQEEVFRLPQCALCYWPGPASDIDVGRIGNPSHPAGRIGNPSYRMGQTTFACLNTAAKLSEEVLALWSRILAAIPGSRLLLRAAGGRRGEERIRDILARCEVSPERLVLLGWMASRFDYLKAYREVAVCLDPFPYNGVTTTCDSLWMGVPVVALAGRMSVSRQGVRLLRNVGLDELIAVTPEDYVRIATALAGDSTRLAALRAGLREQMRRSPLMDAQGCTRRMEAAYREMWDKWAARA